MDNAIHALLIRIDSANILLQRRSHDKRMNQQTAHKMALHMIYLLMRLSCFKPNLLTYPDKTGKMNHPTAARTLSGKAVPEMKGT